MDDATKDSAGARAECRHVELVDQPPEFDAASVNVEHVCAACGKAVAVTSWTREGWDEEQEKERRAQARTSRRLPRVRVRRQG
jgi:hypothetical protein